MTAKQSFSQGARRIGILGGGQLARMLVLKGHEMGLEMHVLSERATDPAAQVTAHWHQGGLNDPDTLRAFFAAVDRVSFESEFLDANLVEAVRERTGTPALPAPRVMGILQDRRTQKEALDRYQLPTSPWIKVDTAADASRALASLGPKLVFKKRRFGYDGYGTFVVKGPADFKRLEAQAPWDQGPLIAERFVPFRKELAISVARNQRGQLAFLPLVESRQEDARCLWVKGPVKHAGLARLKKKIAVFLKGLGYEGIIAFELFATSRGLVVNEIAPRVHNSAHYSLDALSEDQFTLHLKAILGADLKDPVPLAPGFAMLNLLGKKPDPVAFRWPSGVRLHWYGKADSRPGRKMGHLNLAGPSAQSALTRLLKARKEFKL